MKLIIDIDDNVFTRLFDNGVDTSSGDREVIDRAVRNGIPYEESPLNEAIKTIKAVCMANDTCTYCPMNFNCGEYPDVWKI